MIGVEQWAEIRRLYFVEKRSKRAIHRLTGAHRDTITRAVESEAPPRYERKATGSRLDPFKEWICEQLRGIRRSSRSGCGSWLASLAIGAARRCSTITCVRFVLGSWCGGRSNC